MRCPYGCPKRHAYRPVPAATKLAVDDVHRRIQLSLAKGGEIDDLADRDLTLRIMGVPRDESRRHGFAIEHPPRKPLLKQRIATTACDVCGVRTRWASWYTGSPPRRCPNHPGSRGSTRFRWVPVGSADSGVGKPPPQDSS